MGKYRVAQVGCGHRGKNHIDGFLQNPDRFELAAICDLNQERLAAAAKQFGIAKTYTDAETMLAAEKPDVFCFVTPPKIRIELVELGIRHRPKAIAFEKPMATSLAEARRIHERCAQAGVKYIVSHQQKYGDHWHKAKAVFERGEIGDLVRIHASSRAWLSQLGTHLVDYVLWFNGGRRATWVVGHVHGREGLADSHPSPSYTMGEIAFENGVRAFVEFGYLSPQWLPQEKFWTDNRITLYGTHGYAWANTDGEWQAFTRASGGQVIGEQLAFWPEQENKLLQPRYLRDLADWLDDEAKAPSPAEAGYGAHEVRVHPCNGDISYHGFEIMEALCLSAIEHRRVDLPLGELPAETALERLAKLLP